MDEVMASLATLDANLAALTSTIEAMRVDKMRAHNTARLAMGMGMAALSLTPVPNAQGQLPPAVLLFPATMGSFMAHLSPETPARAQKMHFRACGLLRFYGVHDPATNHAFPAELVPPAMVPQARLNALHALLLQAIA